MKIPYTVEAHPETGVYSGKLGMWLFLASEVLFFGALFSSYVLLRVGSADWPNASELLNVPLATVNTVILISSSLTMVMSWASLKLDQYRAFTLYFGATILLSLAFLGIKSVEYAEKFTHHHLPAESTFLALYFTMTGLHAFHVLCGVVVNVYHLASGPAMWKAERERFTNRIEIAGLYWHFVDLVWIFLFPVLYLI